jgi:hypothetical protein
MYNKVLKRPMFNMGGRINQAAGTGITSGLDTPKRGLVDGPGGYAGTRTPKEIEAEILKLYPEKTANQRGFDILESYGSLPSARKDGVYRTIGERLDMRSESFEKKLAEETALKNKARLTILEADQERNIADQLAADALERTKASVSDGIGNTLPYDRRLFNETDRITKSLDNPQFGPTKNYVRANLPSISKANVDIAEMQAKGIGDNLMTMPAEAYELTEDGKWKYSAKNLYPGLVYFDPVQRLYVVPTSATTSMKYPTYEEANAALQSEDKKASAISTETPIKVEKTDGIQTVSLHPVKEGSDEVTDEYVLQYIIDNNIITDSAEYRVQSDEFKKEAGGYKTLNQIKLMLKRENSDTVRKEETDKKTYARKEKEALNWFTRNYERYKDGKVQMPDRFQEFEEVYLGTLAVKVAEAPEKLAAGGRAGYAMGSPEFQGEVVTEELEEIQPDTSVDELADLQTWWKSEIEKDFNA